MKITIHIESTEMEYNDAADSWKHFTHDSTGRPHIPTKDENLNSANKTYPTKAFETERT